MINVWDTLSTFIHLPMMFQLMDFLFERRIGLVAMDLFYIRFAYQQLLILLVFGAVYEPLASFGSSILCLCFQATIFVYI